MSPARLRLGLIGVAFAALVVLISVEGSRWLVQRQGTYLLPDRLLPKPTAIQREAQLHQVAARYPNEYRLHLANALMVWAEGDKIYEARAIRLRALIPRFPNQPSLYAHIVRYESKLIPIKRPQEESAVIGKPSSSESAIPPATPEQLAAFDRAAAMGERLDPENAFFPFMRALGLFAVRRDREALDAIQRAASKNRWEEYWAEEVESTLRLSESAFGKQTASWRAGIQAAILFPHYIRLRSVTRVATYKAIQAERAGRPLEGLAIRRALMRCGSLMRFHSRTLIGSLVGIALTAIAIDQPGGSPRLEGSGLPAEKRAQLRLQRYVDYLHKRGWDGEARWVQAEYEAGQQVRQLTKAAMQHFEPLPSLINLSGWWVGCGMLLANALWMLLLALWAAFLVRTALHEKQGVLILVLLGGYFVFVFWGNTQMRWYVEMEATAKSIQYLAASSEEGRTKGSLPALAGVFFMMGRLFPLLAALIPALVVLRYLVRSLNLGLPFLTGLVQGLQRTALPVAGLLLLLYVGLALGTLQAEKRLHSILDRTLQHEGRYYAQLLGKPWPPLPLISAFHEN